MYKFKIMTWHNIAVKYYGRHFCQVWKKWGGIPNCRNIENPTEKSFHEGHKID